MTPGRRPWSLRLRLVTALVVLAGLGLATVSTAGVLLLQDYLLSRVDEQLIAVGRTITEGLRPLPPPGQRPPELPSDFRIEVFDAGGALRTAVGRTGAGPPLPAPAGLRASGGVPFTAVDDVADEPWRVLAVPAGPDTVVVEISLRDPDATVDRLLQVTVAVGVLVLLVVTGIANAVVRVGLRPLVRIERTADAIADGALDRRVEGAATTTETGRLAIALNVMLARLAGALDERARSETTLRRFIADASHELRTPLTSIRGFAELYRHGGAPERADTDDAMRRIEDEATRMGLLVDDLLALARLDAERPLARAEVDLGALARGVVDVARPRVEDGRSLGLHVPARAVTAIGDENRLRQVVAELVDNALAHTRPGTAVTVTVDATSIEVHDDGAGLSPAQQARVFDRFYRAGDGASRGSGLGLSIAHAVVTAHGGTLTVHSAAGTGCTFRMELPGRGRPVTRPGPRR